jgi:DNA polymerase-3 subunit delta
MFERNKRGWVMRFFREKGLRADNSAVDLLLDVTEGTTDALREACELLAFSVDSQQIISEADIDRVLEHGREETVYSLFDRFCRRDLGGVLEAYRKIMHSDPGSVDRILSMLADSMVHLRDFAALVTRGLSPENAVRELKLRGGKRAVRAYTDGAHRFSEDELTAAVRRLIDLESWLRTAPRELRAPKTEIWFCSVIGRT